MLSIRIVTAAALLVAGICSASAQTAAATVPGKPIPLLQIVQHPTKEKARSHVKRAVKTARRTRHKERRIIAREDAAPAPVQTAAPAPAAADVAPAPVWPAVNAPATTATDTAFPTPAAAAAPPDPPAIAVGDQTVQVVSPADVNDIDANAGAQDPKSQIATKGGLVTKGGLAPKGNLAQAAPAAQAMVANTPHQDAGAVGTASWIAKVLAALGGAIAAGSAAWFLIGVTPLRTYG